MHQTDRDFDCTFRSAERMDYDALHTLLQTGWLEIYRPYISEESARRFVSEDAVGDHLREFLATMEVAVIGGKIVGVVNCFNGFVTALFVAPRFRRNGIGSALMHNAELRGGYHLEASAFNTDCISFYEHRGWRRKVTMSEDWFGTRLPAIAFQLQ